MTGTIFSKKNHKTVNGERYAQMQLLSFERSRRVCKYSEPALVTRIKPWYIPHVKV